MVSEVCIPYLSTFEEAAVTVKLILTCTQITSPLLTENFLNLALMKKKKKKQLCEDGLTNIFPPEMSGTSLFSPISCTICFHLEFQEVMGDQHLGPYEKPSSLGAVGFERGWEKLTFIQ